MADKKEKNIIRIKGAREHNLKNINIDIPRDQLVVITGLSGSGKSSLLVSFWDRWTSRMLITSKACPPQFQLIRRRQAAIRDRRLARLRKSMIICGFCLPGPDGPIALNAASRLPSRR